MRQSPYILIATHDAECAALCRESAASMGVDAQIAHDGLEAMEIIAREGDPLLLLTDGSMAGVGLPGDAPVGARGGSGAACTILAADMDSASLRRAIERALDDAALDGAAWRGGTEAATAEDALHRAIAEAARKFQVPLCVGYVNVGGHEHLASHARTDGRGEWALTPPPLSWFRDIAATGEPLILPDVAEAAGEAGFSDERFKGFRGVAGMPISSASGLPPRSSLLCLLDTEPLTLQASDFDALAELVRALGQNLDQPTDPWTVPSIRHARVASRFATLERLAVTDPLTGLANRRGGDQHIAAEISRAKRQKTALSCILLDVDRFKTVNDTYGHQVGDFLLREFGALLRRTLRAYDILVRWGGEEFLIVLPGVSLDVARGLAERVRRAVELLPTHGVGRISVSAGVAALDESYDFDGMLSQADRQLYHAKTSGRNRVA